LPSTEHLHDKLATVGRKVNKTRNCNSVCDLIDKLRHRRVNVKKPRLGLVHNKYSSCKDKDNDREGSTFQEQQCGCVEIISPCSIRISRLPVRKCEHTNAAMRHRLDANAETASDVIDHPERRRTD
jgi:hypothetical protein